MSLNNNINNNNNNDIIFKTIEINECSEFGVGIDPCLYTYSINKSTCNNTITCSNLVIYFSGGQMSCPIPNDNTKSNYLDYYTRNGYIGVCAMLFNSSYESGIYPYLNESIRVNTLINTIIKDPIILNYWNKDNLLLTGVSHGSISSVIAMMRTDYDKNWYGLKQTGACYYDGSYNMKEDISNLSFHRCGNSNSILSYERAYSRYCKWTGGNQPATWPPPESCNPPSLNLDVVDDLSIFNLSIKNWKIIECGSNTNYCLMDVLNEGSQYHLCSRISSKLSDGYNCEYQSFPTIGHSSCGISSTTMSSCHDWFNKIIKQSTILPSSNPTFFPTTLPTINNEKSSSKNSNNDNSSNKTVGFILGPILFVILCCLCFGGYYFNKKMRKKTEEVQFITNERNNTKNP